MKNINKNFHHQGRDVEVVVRKKGGATKLETVKTGRSALTMKDTTAFCCIVMNVTSRSSEGDKLNITFEIEPTLGRRVDCKRS